MNGRNGPTYERIAEMLAATMERPTAKVFGTEVERWEAVKARDPAADDVFFYSVRTTGVYCRPSCAARLARRENVAFHATTTAAERAGFRPCKRCRPDEPPRAERHAAAVTKACRLIETAVEAPGLDALAEATGMSSFHLHRVFKHITGVTPKAYAVAHRAGRVRDELEKSQSITGAIYGAGFNSSGRFYAASSELLGMTPTQFRAGGKGALVRFAVGQCSLGAILVAATDKGVCAITFGEDAEPLVRDLQNRFPKAEIVGGDERFERTIADVIAFVEAPGHGLDLPLDVRGTAFQQKVWQALRDIPPGETASYSDVAARIGRPKAVRAVASACAANPVAVAVPCHRVVRNDGAMGGYRWGVERKRALIARERAQ